MSKRQAYFDNASTTPLDSRVLKAMMPYLEGEYGNPSNLYAMGRHAKAAIAEAGICFCNYLILDVAIDKIVLAESL